MTKTIFRIENRRQAESNQACLNYRGAKEEKSANALLAMVKTVAILAAVTMFAACEPEEENNPLDPGTEQDADFVTFTFEDIDGTATIDKTTHTVTAKAKETVDLTALVVEFTLSTGATATVDGTPQVSKTTANNFTSPVTYEVTSGDGETTLEWTVTVTGGKIADGVLINGITWATRNVDAPGTFTATHLDRGMYYRWGNPVGWSNTDPITSSPAGVPWDDDYDPSDIEVWPADNDPCPEGWRLPTKADFDALLDRSKVSGQLTQIAFGKGSTFTDIATGNAVFFPYTGGRARDGELANSGGTAAYWTNEQFENNMYNAYYMNGGVMIGNSFVRALRNGRVVK